MNFEMDPEESGPSLFSVEGREYQDFTKAFTKRVKKFACPKYSEYTPGTVIYISTYKHRGNTPPDAFLSEKDIIFKIKEVDCPPHGDWSRTVDEGSAGPSSIRLE